MVEATIQAVEKRPLARATFWSCAMRIWFIVVNRNKMNQGPFNGFGYRFQNASTAFMRRRFSVVT